MPVLQRFRLWYQFDVVRRVYSLELGTPSSPLHKVRYVVFTFDLRPLAEGRIAVAAALPPRDSILQNRLGCRTLELLCGAQSGSFRSVIVSGSLRHFLLPPVTASRLDDPL